MFSLLTLKESFPHFLQFLVAPVVLDLWLCNSVLCHSPLRLSPSSVPCKNSSWGYFWKKHLESMQLECFFSKWSPLTGSGLWTYILEGHPPPQGVLGCGPMSWRATLHPRELLKLFGTHSREVFISLISFLTIALDLDILELLELRRLRMWFMVRSNLE